MTYEVTVAGEKTATGGPAGTNGDRLAGWLAVSSGDGRSTMSTKCVFSLPQFLNVISTAARETLSCAFVFCFAASSKPLQAWCGVLIEVYTVNPRQSRSKYERLKILFAVEYTL